jgi:hypothetical protein
MKMDRLMLMQSAYDIARARKREKEIHVHRVYQIKHGHPRPRIITPAIQPASERFDLIERRPGSRIPRLPPAK